MKVIMEGTLLLKKFYEKDDEINFWKIRLQIKSLQTFCHIFGRGIFVTKQINVFFSAYV